jgi:DNA-binding transcriptional LysR family regulator
MIHALEYFLAIAKAGSFSRVARERNVAVSSVTRKLDWLEGELAVKLLHRSSRVVLLTDAGVAFLPRARTILAELAGAREQMAALYADPRGQMTVTAPSAFGRRYVAPAIAEFLKKHPLVEIDLHVSDDIVDLVAQRVDVAIRIGELPDSDLLATKLASAHRSVCASPAYLAAHGRPASLSGLLEHNCLTVGLPVPAVWWSFEGVNRGQPLPVRGNLRCDDTDSLLKALLGGLGICHMANWLVGDDIRAGNLISLFPDAGPPRTMAPPAIHAVRMPGRSHTGKTQLLIDHLRQYFAALPSWDRDLDVISQRDA